MRTLSVTARRCAIDNMGRVMRQIQRKLLSTLLVALAVLPATPAQSQSESTPAAVQFSDIELVGNEAFRMHFTVDGVRDSIEVPQLLLVELATQMQRARNRPQAAQPGAAGPESPQTGGAKRAFARAHSPTTGKDYVVEIFADSLLSIRYQEAGTVRVFPLPADLLGILYRHNRQLSGKMERETQLYFEPRSGAFWVALTQGFNYKAILFVLALALGGLVLFTVRLSTKRIRRERDELRSSRRRMIRVREAERSHLASELHDGPVQDVQRILRSSLSSLAHVIPTSESDDLTELEATLRQVAGSLRNICSDLKPPVLAHFGLEKAAESCLRAFQLRNPGVEVHQDLSLGPDELSEESRLVAYRILQETLNNVEKHSGAKTIRVELTQRRDEVRLSVNDDGRGFRENLPFPKLEERGHFGLSGMRQRVDSIGGMLYVDSAVGKGTRITVLIPAIVSEGLDLSTVDGIL